MRKLVTTLRAEIRIRRRVAMARWRAKRPRHGRPHCLPGELVVSLTSFPARFPTLHLTIGCLLDQTVKADRTVLWIAHEDLPALPKAVTKLERRGLEIRACEDLRSYKKLVPARESFPDAYILTADDDLEFSRDWLETLVDGASAQDRSIVCHRAHRAAWSAEGRLADYLEWEFDVQDERARRPSMDIMPTTGAGALFPPHVLPDFATDRSLFGRLCPDGDDVWFWWCARLAGTPIRKVGGVNSLFTWPGSQESTLWEINRAGGNDRMIQELSVAFPAALTLTSAPGRAPRSRKALVSNQ